MRLLVAVVVVKLLLFQALGRFCRAEAASDPGTSEEGSLLEQGWSRAMQLGEAALSRGEYQEALGHFLDADAMDFPETPNYEALPKIAEASCRLGDRATGQAIVADLRCILDVDSGVIPCYVGQESRAAPGHPNPALTPLCFERMCGEILLAYYESPSDAQSAKIEALRQVLDRLDKICGDEPER